MDQDKKIVGYRIKFTQHGTELSLHRDDDGFFHFLRDDEPQLPPMTRVDAFYVLASYFNHSDREEFDVTTVRIVPVFEPVKTPLQNAASELGALLTSLTKRHGVKLEMTQEQIERQIAIELASLGASF